MYVNLLSNKDTYENLQRARFQQSIIMFNSKTHFFKQRKARACTYRSAIPYYITALLYCRERGCTEKFESSCT